MVVRETLRVLTAAEARARRLVHGEQPAPGAVLESAGGRAGASADNGLGPGAPPGRTAGTLPAPSFRAATRRESPLERTALWWVQERHSAPLGAGTRLSRSEFIAQTTALLRVFTESRRPPPHYLEAGYTILMTPEDELLRELVPRFAIRDYGMLPARLRYWYRRAEETHDFYSPQRAPSAR
jgi:hypothetical protein